ncbi:MAG TPA: glutamine-hydrolyzing carbamoyl-phosphate synthase small subunit [Chloroflexota bacterium]|nr:glutamine-hydrolyzing carbamoyl-phosphate synthase small subunit [Chloroflexota bacterium]
MHTPSGVPGVLVLEDGTVYPGTTFGAPVEAAAEVVFNTGITGYQEIATDPSYRGQMVVLTHPQIGNYGVDAAVAESTRPWVAALIVRELARFPHHWRSAEPLEAYLARHGVPGLEDVDTRALTRRLRTRGTMRGVLAPAPASGLSAAFVEELAARARALPALGEQPVVQEVIGAAAAALRETRPHPSPLPEGEGAGRLHPSPLPGGEGASFSSLPEGEGPGVRARPVVVLDCGAKHNILRSLERRGIAVAVVEPTASLAEVKALQPAGIVLANGPGDPAALPEVVALVRGLLDLDVPVMGICLGHQLLAQAAGATTSRLRYGHHGGNHPVKDLRTGRVYITTQNHEFQVDAASLPAASGFVVSHVNLNDNSVEGIAHRERPIFSVQFHPEGCPGPQDNQYLFDYFLDELVGGQARKAER